VLLCAAVTPARESEKMSVAIRTEKNEAALVEWQIITKLLLWLLENHAMRLEALGGILRPICLAAFCLVYGVVPEVPMQRLRLIFS
jgi:hypothetical protein